jgi:hypothetical protein
MPSAKAFSDEALQSISVDRALGALAGDGETEAGMRVLLRGGSGEYREQRVVGAKRSPEDVPECLRGQQPGRAREARSPRAIQVALRGRVGRGPWRGAP